MIAATGLAVICSASPPALRRFTSVGGTTRRNNVHNSSGTNRSTRPVTHDSPNDHAKRDDV